MGKALSFLVGTTGFVACLVVGLCPPGRGTDDIELRFALVGLNTEYPTPVGEAGSYTFDTYNVFARRVSAGSKKRCQGQAYAFPPELDSITLDTTLLP